MKKTTFSFILTCLAACSAWAQSKEEALAEFDWLTGYIQRNYPGYEHKTKDSEKEWNEWVEDKRKAISLQPDTVVTCMDEYVRKFNDGHMYLRMTNEGMAAFNDVLQRLRAQQAPHTGKSYSMYYTAKAMDDSTYFLRIPSFGNDMSNKLVRDNWDSITSRPYLIVDLRSNGGGNDEHFSELMRLVYSKPYWRHGVELYATPDFLSLYRRIAAEDADKEWAGWYTEMADSVEKHLGGYVLRPGLQRKILVSQDTVYTNPRKIGILIHGRNASSAEQFILEAKESDKVTLFGNENTRGVIDLSNVYDITSPKGWFKLAIPTTRSCRLPEISIDGIGISPQIPVPYEESLQEKDNIGEEIKYMERVLRGMESTTR